MKYRKPNSRNLKFDLRYEIVFASIFEMDLNVATKISVKIRHIAYRRPKFIAHSKPLKRRRKLAYILTRYHTKR